MTDSIRYRKTFILISTLVLCGVFMWLIRNYLIAVILAAVFGILLHPAHRYLQRVLRTGPSITSGLVIFAFFIAVGIPFFALAGLAAAEALAVSKAITPWLNEHIYNDGALSIDWPTWLPFRAEIETYQAPIFEKIGEIAGGIAQFLFNSIENATRGTIGALLSLFIFVYSLFFFLKRGSDVVDSALRYLPINETERDLFIERGSTITKAVLKSILIIGVLQGTLVGLAFWVLGLDGPVFWGAVVVILSAIPLLGSGIVWIPTSIYLLVNGQPAAAAALALWGILVVGVVDNILRPRLVGSEAKVPDLLVLLAILGGLSAFGVAGVIVGPILAVFLLTVLEIYRAEFTDWLPTKTDAEEIRKVKLT